MGTVVQFRPRPVEPLREVPILITPAHVVFGCLMFWIGVGIGLFEAFR